MLKVYRSLVLYIGYKALRARVKRPPLRKLPFKLRPETTTLFNLKKFLFDISQNFTIQRVDTSFQMSWTLKKKWMALFNYII